ncbi:PREDICTED: E3 SUMO-protein ligase SIZ2-like isoform X2 [Populus euphratica]|uniref:E3 SUMO-protein ligase SIZ2-like isoform X2 n=1 Tax=Populus euphratica TaxID=75702 RepID=A0AAJ6XKT1_POPEU|nr:PREDICTED: E3 SUMO-protein ligase SIZ2-like isoform X2 [Populus euphratica]
MAGMMAGTMMPTPQAAEGVTIGAAGQQMSASLANSFRVHAVAERLSLHIQPGFDSNPTEFFGLCLSLARGIDFAVANNETLLKAQELPFLLKQVCQRKNDVFLQAAIMVLMASVKNACMVGWFQEKETQELVTLATEIGKVFCTPGDINAGTTDSLSIISTIMSRFYPLMKMGQIIVSLEVKPGFGAHVIDFHISKTTRNLTEDKIWLFVAQTDNTETSTCIVTPQEVNFLLNGKGVERRTNVIMDTGPQMPTNVTGMLKYGTNLLQAVGQFKGHYVIAVAFMSVEPKPETPVLQDYVHPSAAELDPDSDIIEGPSRISLNCPISYTRIRTPVKGHSCRHLQCFDFSNFVDINTRRPSWRCPHCNQHVCYTDIRIDQNMVKVLREVGDHCSVVIISADGSLKAISESDNKVDQTQERTLHCDKSMPEQVESMTSMRALPVVMDLTVDDDDINGKDNIDAEDRKPFLATLQNHPVDTNPIPTMPSQLVNTNAPSRNFSTLADEFWSSPYWSSSASDAQMVNGFSEPSTTTFMTSPVITDSVSPALNCDVGGYGNTTTSVMHNQLSASSYLQSLQQKFVNSVANGEYGTLPPIYHVNRSPIAVQALPARPQTPAPQQRSRTPNPAISSGASLSSHGTLPEAANGLSSVSGNMDRQQQFARSLNMNSSSSQNWNLQDHPFMHGQSAQQQAVTLPSSSQLAGAHRASSPNLLYQQPLRVPQSRSHSPNVVRSSLPLAPALTQQGAAQVGNSAGATNSQQSRLMVAAQLVAQRARQPPSVPVQIQTSGAGASYLTSADGIRAPATEQRGNAGGALPAVSGTEGLVDLASEQNWRPTGRMRGSLSGRAYSAALKEFMVQPTQQTQTPRPPPNLPPSQSSMPPHLQFLFARNAQVPQAQSSPVSGSAISNGSSSTLP